MKRDVYAEVTEKMIDALENGVVPWRKPWTTWGAHRNLVSGREYRGINVFLTALSAARGGFERPAWVTMKQANAMGARVRAGEKGTMVVFWEPRVDVRKLDNGEEEERRRLVFKKYYVWNVEQLDGIVLPELPAVGGAGTHADAERVWDAYPGKPGLEHGGDRAYYAPGLDVIQMPLRSRFAGTGAYYQVLFHEAIHSTGAKTRLNRSTLTRRWRLLDVLRLWWIVGSPARARAREMVSGAVGVEVVQGDRGNDGHQRPAGFTVDAGTEEGRVWADLADSWRRWFRRGLSPVEREAMKQGIDGALEVYSL